MIEQGKLLECMEEIKAIAVSSQNRLTVKEVGNYLDGMGLDGRQMEAVYQYLVSQGIHVEGYDGAAVVPDSANDEKNRGADKKQKKRAASPEKKASSKGTGQTKAQRNLALYRREVSALPEGDQDGEAEKLGRFLGGEKSLRDDILHSQLRNVIRIAGDYKKRGVPVEDVIAEGNLGLMNAVVLLEEQGESFCHSDGKPDIGRINNMVEREIRQAMETMIDGQNESRDREDTIVARINLLHEAAKYLAEDLGRAASREELSEYTKVPVQEINDIMGLSEDVRGMMN